MYEVLARIIDGSDLDEYKAGYGKTIVTGYARIDGWAVGIVANQRAVVKTSKGEMQVGGVIYSDSADKAARFIMNCNQKLIPLVFFQDVTGFMVGSRAEQGGIIKDGAKMVNAVANSVVPKFTFIVGNSYGAGNYAMCGKAYDPRLIFAWPTAQIAVMGGKQASETLLAIKLQQMEKAGGQLGRRRREAAPGGYPAPLRAGNGPVFCRGPTLGRRDHRSRRDAGRRLGRAFARVAQPGHPEVQPRRHPDLTPSDGGEHEAVHCGRAHQGAARCRRRSTRASPGQSPRLRRFLPVITSRRC